MFMLAAVRQARGTVTVHCLPWQEYVVLPAACAIKRTVIENAAQPLMISHNFLDTMVIITINMLPHRE